MPFHSPPLFLYAMSCKSDELKIGHSARPAKRRIELGYKYPALRPFTLEYVTQIDVSDAKEIYRAEYHTHRLLAPWLSRGEDWFRVRLGRAVDAIQDAAITCLVDGDYIPRGRRGDKSWHPARWIRPW